MSREQPDYQAASLAATRLLLAQRLHSLRFDVTGLHHSKPIIIDSMQHYCAVTRDTMDRLRCHGDTRDGLTLRKTRNGTALYIVLYNQDAGNLRRRNFTLAHELGHIYLEHSADDSVAEREANHFAAQLLAPRILVEQLARQWDCPLTPGDLCGVFGVSLRAAQNRLQSLRASISHSPEDLALLRRFCGLLPQADGPLISV